MKSMLSRLRGLQPGILTYWNAHRDWVCSGNAAVPVSRLAIDFPMWNRLRSGKTTPLQDRLPWMTVSAIRFLQEFVKPGMNVFEWGMGGSTLFLLECGANVVSVEHDESWFAKATETIGQRAEWTPVLATPEPGGEPQDPSEWSNYETTDESTRTCRFKNYAEKIDPWREGHFHLVLIDGRSRPSCLHHAVPKVARGGCLLLDNSERETYRKEADAVTGECCKRLDFSGATAYVPFFTSTTIWQKH